MSVIIEKAGLLDTIQDAGRVGWGHLGINPNGPMDWYAHALANALVGNQENTPVIELHFPASTFRFTEPASIALAGADFGASVNNIPIPVNRMVQVPAGARLHFSRKWKGERCYLAIQNGWQVHASLGSTSTNLKSKFGGYNGRKLMSGDQVNYRKLAGTYSNRVRIANSFVVPIPMRPFIRVLPGPEWDWLDDASQSSILKNEFVLSRHSDRMALSWDAQPLSLKSKNEMVSSAVTMGTIQLLPNGQLLTLMADHQTVGGYPRVLQVIRADLPILAQLAPGSIISFVCTNIEVAFREWQQMKSHLQQIANAVRLQMAFG